MTFHRDAVVLAAAQASVEFYDPLRAACGLPPGQVLDDDLEQASHMLDALLTQDLIVLPFVE